MPALTPTMTEGMLSKWMVKVGDQIRSGDVIAEIETDKATMEVEAVDDGTVTQLVVQEGTQAVPVGTIIATISGDSDDEPEIINQNKNPPDSPNTSPQVEPASRVQHRADCVAAAGGRRMIATAKPLQNPLRGYATR